MAITRKQVDGLNEAELRTRILLPLFRAMGYQDVEHYHGGALELGKDLLMWQKDPVRGKVRIAVVVKAGRVSGKAAGSGSAAEVATQVRQCFGSDYLTGTSLKAEKVDRCFVVCSGEFKKEARAALVAALGRDFDAMYDVVDGDLLWAYIEEHLPGHRLLEELSRMSEALLSESTEHFDVQAILKDGQVALGVSLKPGSVEPEELSTRLKALGSRDSQEARAHEALLRHLETGEGTSVSRVSVGGLKVPEILQPLLENGSESGGTIALLPRGSEVNIPAALVVTGLDGEEAVLDGLDFRLVQGGSREWTIDNWQQKHIWHVRLRVDFQSKRMEVTLRSPKEGLGVRQRLQAARVQGVLARGGKMQLEIHSTGVIMKLEHPSPTAPSEPDVLLLDTLERVLEIQKATGVRIIIPDRAIQGDEIQRIVELSSRLRAGTMNANVDRLHLLLRREAADMVLIGAFAEPGQFVATDTQRWQILDTALEIADVEIQLMQFAFTEAHRSEVRSYLKDNPDAQEIPLDLKLVAPAGQGRISYQAIASRRIVPQENGPGPDAVD